MKKETQRMVFDRDTAEGYRRLTIGEIRKGLPQYRELLSGKRQIRKLPVTTEISIMYWDRIIGSVQELLNMAELLEDDDIIREGAQNYLMVEEYDNFTVVVFFPYLGKGKISG